MKRILFGIFAHPDDEGFGPSGTLIKEVDNGAELHLMCVTRGEAGMNPDHCEDLGMVRYKEWRNAGKLIGASSMHCLGFADGSLCNNIYHELAHRIEACIVQILEREHEPFEVEIMTFDTSGLSGHLDHVALSMIVTYTFLRLRQERTEWAFKRLRYFCLAHDKRFAHNTAYVYMPPGRAPTEIDEIVDVSDVMQRKLAVMHAHQSQRTDLAWHLEHRADELRREYFCYFK